MALWTQREYWERELGGIKTTGEYDVVRVQFTTRYTNTKTLRLTPEQFERIEAFMLDIAEGN